MMEEQPKKRGRKPVGAVARTVAQRKRDQRERLAEAVDRDSHEWNEAVCLSILNGKRWRRGAIDKAAWQQLGKLRGFV